ncbi:diguanylate cyclase [Vagococcus sp. WN89Y]|uniref:diguanylate cyclase n=1 Tax=Vagococcus sp. WN89Y TaxID=3457258 RepID=UPI003FCE9BC2
MRIATITNFAYVATVTLTLISGVALFLASHAERDERTTVARIRLFDALTDNLEKEAFALSNLAREAVLKPLAENVQSWKTRVQQDITLENQLEELRSQGASSEELHVLHDGITTLAQLEEEQRIALADAEAGKTPDAINLLFNGNYDEKVSEAEYRFAHFRSLADQRLQAEMTGATERSVRLRTLSEVMVGLTALLFLFVLGFIIKHRILRPVVTLSDVINRLATQDYAVEAPMLAQVDEIGDMAQAIRIFRENGLARQRLEQERDAEWGTRTLLARMTQRLQGCDSQQAIVRVVSRFAPEIIPDMGGRLYILNPRTHRMKCVARWGLPPGEDAPITPESCWALKRGQLHSPAKDAVDMPCEHIQPDIAARAVCVPLNAQNKSIGLLTFDNYTPQKEPPYAYLELLAETLALAFANQILRDTLTEKATYDSLTGLRNRHSLDETLRTMLEQAMVEGSMLSCLMMDVDYFKTFNDQHGHDAGDKVLRELAKLMTDTLDENSVAFRYGGEEFLIILPDTNETQAKQVAGTLLSNVLNHPILFESQNIGPVSVSIGVATWPRHASADNLVRAADLALYLAKEQGRGKIVVARHAG